MKNVFLLLIGILVAVISNPIILGASDDVRVTEIDSTRVVQTVAATDPASDVLVEQIQEASVSDAAVAEMTVAVKPVETAVPTDAISIAGRVIPIVNVTNTAIDAGDHVNKYGAKFLYGHNSPAVFGDLVYVGVGNVFMVSDGGVTNTYQVAEVQIFEKASETTLSSNGVTYRMSAVANGKGRYDMVLMTCYGTMYGNGDASHRLVLFANRV